MAPVARARAGRRLFRSAEDRDECHRLVIAAAWLNFEGTKVGFNLAIVTGILVMALTLVLVCVSMTINERR